MAKVMADFVTVLTKKVLCTNTNRERVLPKMPMNTMAKLRMLRDSSCIFFNARKSVCANYLLVYV